MKTKQGWKLGVCSWSMQVGIDEVIANIASLGLSHVHLALGPALKDGSEAYLEKAKASDWTITSTMIDFPQEDYSSLDSIRATGGIVPDAEWPENRALFAQAVRVTAELGVSQLSFHAGFLDHDNEMQKSKFYDRVREVADIAAKLNICVLLETGQESADDLGRFMEDVNHPSLGINFDPANTILYDKGTPAEAVRTLSRWVRHVHIKDATRTKTPGSWGAEVPWGDGEVGGDSFLAILSEIGFTGAVAIEREAGDQRMTDIRTAVSRLT